MISTLINKINHDFQELNKSEIVCEGTGSSPILIPVTIPVTIFPFQYMDEAISQLQNLCMNLEDLEDYYTKIYPSKELTTVPSSIPINDVGEISKIKPQYLKQFSENVPNIIQKTMTGKLSKDDISIMLNEEYKKNLRNQVVVSKLPDYIRDKDLVRIDTKHVYAVNTNFITTTILPFIRSMPVILKSLVKLNAELKKTIAGTVENLNTYSNTLKRLSKEGKPVDESSKYALISCQTIAVDTSKFAMACFIRKTNSYLSNLREFYKLRETLTRYFPDDVLHESVLDGKMDYRDEDIIYDLINGDSNFLVASNDRIHDFFYDLIEKENFESDISRRLEDVPYDVKPYQNINGVLRNIGKSLARFQDELINPDTSIDDILDRSGLSRKFTDQYSSIIPDISSTHFYTAYDNANKFDVIEAILSELKGSRKEIAIYGKLVKVLYEKIKLIGTALKDNINNQYSNYERNKETIEILNELDRDFKNFVVVMTRELLERYKNLRKDMEDVEVNHISPIDPIEVDVETDFTSEINEAVVELAEVARNDEMIKFMESFKRDIIYGDLQTKAYFEADDANQTNSNDSSQPVVSQNANGTDQNNNNTNQNQNGTQNNNSSNSKPTVTDNNTETTSNASGGQSNNTDKGFWEKIKEKIKNFLDKIKEKINKLTESNKKNLAWLSKNKQALLNRSYTNVSVNILPYTETEIFELLDTVITEIKSFDIKRVKKMKEDDVENQVYAKINLKSIKTDNKEATTADKITQFAKVGKAPLKTIPVSNSELASLIPKMIAFCESYYNSFASSNETYTNRVNNLVDEFSEKMLKPDSDESEGNLQTKVTNITTCLTTTLGACANAAKDKANDYITVLSQLVPKQSPNEGNNNNQNTDNQNSDNNGNTENS